MKHSALRVSSDENQFHGLSPTAIEAAGASKMTFAKIQPIINFFGANVQTLFAFSVALKSEHLKSFQMVLFPDAISVGFLSSN